MLLDVRPPCLLRSPSIALRHARLERDITKRANQLLWLPDEKIGLLGIRSQRWRASVPRNDGLLPLNFRVLRAAILLQLFRVYHSCHVLRISVPAQRRPRQAAACSGARGTATATTVVMLRCCRQTELLHGGSSSSRPSAVLFFIQAGHQSFCSEV